MTRTRTNPHDRRALVALRPHRNCLGGLARLWGFDTRQGGTIFLCFADRFHLKLKTCFVGASAEAEQRDQRYDSPDRSGLATVLDDVSFEWRRPIAGHRRPVRVGQEHFAPHHRHSGIARLAGWWRLDGQDLNH